MCPEQYDVWQGKLKVGYIRLRWGGLSVSFDPTGKDAVSGRDVFYHEFEDGFKGKFDSEAERGFYLNKAKRAILAAIREEK